MSLRLTLDRTLRLMGDEFGRGIPDERLLAALTDTSVALVADEANLACHSAQTAFVTAAMLMARSGHKVALVAPNIELVGLQPPLVLGRLIDGLAEIGGDMLPGVKFETSAPSAMVDLAVALGDSTVDVPAHRTIRINAGPWSGAIQAEARSTRWAADSWPLGALAAAGLAADEALKVAILSLLPHALNRDMTSAVFAYTDEYSFALAPETSPTASDLGRLDCISGGAITNAALYCLARIPNVSVLGRIIEPEHAALDNLNRYVLLRRSAAERRAGKAVDLAAILAPCNLHFAAVPERFTEKTHLELAPTVLVGVDHIPTRWTVQRARPDWLVVGATSHWSAMASFHSLGLGCAHCLHPTDDPDDQLIPTVACVSFWAGLLSATYIARHAAGEVIPLDQQQIYLTPFRPEKLHRAPVPLRPRCPTCDPS
jgi:hypothetical protein